MTDLVDHVNGNSESSNDSLNGSWVKLDTTSRNSNSLHHSPTASQDGAMVDLIAEAVEEHFKQNSSNDEGERTLSPQSEQIPASHQAVLPQEKSTDWIWEWSSRVETRPPKGWKLKNVSKRGASLSIRRTKVMKSGAELLKLNVYIVVPTLVLSHILAFGIGLYIGRKMVDSNVS